MNGDAPDASEGAAPVTAFEREIAEQPAVLERVLADGAVAAAAAALRERAPRSAMTLARGSSDNAATFFAYLAGRWLGLPVASIPPSLLTVYDAPLRGEGSAVVAVSQSGESPDVLQAMTALARAGALAVAVSNEPGSPLIAAADHGLEQHAGEERAVAASKTFTSQLMVLARLVAEWSDDDALRAALARVPEAVRAVLASPVDDAVNAAALRLTHADRAVVLGRGFAYAPALELALKLTETSYLQAQPFSSAEFQHGPIAALSPRTPVLLLDAGDAARDGTLEAAARLRELDADLTVLAADPRLHEGADAAVPLGAALAGAELDERGATVVESFALVVAGQRLALRLAASRGLDPDAPRHLAKVTRTV